MKNRKARKVLYSFDSSDCTHFSVSLLLPSPSAALCAYARARLCTDSLWAHHPPSSTSMESPRRTRSRSHPKSRSAPRTSKTKMTTTTKPPRVIAFRYHLLPDQRSSSTSSPFSLSSASSSSSSSLTIPLSQVLNTDYNTTNHCVNALHSSFISY